MIKKVGELQPGDPVWFVDEPLTVAELEPAPGGCTVVVFAPDRYGCASQSLPLHADALVEIRADQIELAP